MSLFEVEHPIFTAIRLRQNARLLELVTPVSLTTADSEGVTPLLFAALEGRPGAVHILCQLGANLFQVDKAGRTAFLCAAAEGHDEICSILFACNPGTARSCTKSGNSSIHRAAAYGRTHLLSTLLHAGCPLNAVNNAGETPLGRASRWGHTSAVQALLEAGADPMIGDNSGLRPIDWALRKGFDDVVQLLSTFAPPPRPSRKSMRPTAATAALMASQSEDSSSLATGAARSRAYSGALPRVAEEGTAAGGTSGFKTVDVVGDHASGDEDDDSRQRSFTDTTDYAEESGPATVEGWMYKRGHIVRNWKRRWFVLEDRTLRYFATPESKFPKGTILLVPDTEVFIEAKYPKPNSFTILTPSKRFILNCECEDDMTEWLEMLLRNLACVPWEKGAPFTGSGGGDDD